MITDTSLREFFDEQEGEFLKFDRVQDKLSNRPDLHAFMLLDRLVPGTNDIVAGADHDEIYIGVEADELVKVASPEQLIDLYRCGVRFDEDNGIVMFV